VINKWVLALVLCSAIGGAQAKSCKDSTTFGSWLSGEAVANNPDGEDYAADSGSILQLGCTWFLDQSVRYTGNVAIGYRYQLDNSGDGRSKGWSLESSLGAHFGGLLFGGGARFQFASEVRDYYGVRTKIKPSLGAFAYVGWSLGRGLEIQLRQHYLPLESKDGVEYSAADYGIFLHQAF